MLPAILVRHTATIILLLFFQNLFGQVKFGTYTQLDTTFYADLKLYSDKKFDFYDTRDGSCWVWTHYIGKWKLNKDTIIFSWQSIWTESSDSIISSLDSRNENLQLKFIYDDGKPIPNVKASLSCSFENNIYYYTDITGIVTIPKKTSESSDKRMCAPYDRKLSYDIKNEVIKLSSNTSLDYYADSLDNTFTIIIKKKPKSSTQTITKKYLLNGDALLDIDRKEFFNYNWGDFKFTTTKYGR